MSANDDRDPLFRYDDPVFADERLLEITHLPGPDRIVGRDEQMQRVADALNPAIFGSEPNHLFIFGKTGTGKSLISRSVTKRVISEARRDDVTVKYAFIDCGEQNTEASIIKTIAQLVNDSSESGITIPDRGLGTGDYYKRLWQAVDRCTDVTIVILDEIDMLEDDEVLRKLSRAGENRRISDSSIGIIGISNKIDFPDHLSERVKSSLSRDELVFSPYDANQLVEILEKRRDAFHDGVLSGDVIPLTAALAAQEHGDARKAIDILRNAGRIAKKQNATRVTADHVRDAKEKTEADRFNELIEGSPQQAKAILYSLTLLTENSSEKEFPTKIIYNQYKEVANRLDFDVLSERRVQEILQEQNFLNVIQSEREGRGRGRGAHAKHRLLENPSIVKKVLLRDSRLAPLEEGANDTSGSSSTGSRSRRSDTSDGRSERGDSSSDSSPDRSDRNHSSSGRENGSDRAGSGSADEDDATDETNQSDSDDASAGTGENGDASVGDEGSGDEQSSVGHWS